VRGDYAANSDPHRWILQALGILAVAILAGYDLVTPDADVGREVYLIIGGISIGVRPETLAAIWKSKGATS
jgi:hypothetical protein